MYFSRTRPDHRPTQLTKEAFLQLPTGTKIRAHHAVGSGIVETLLGFEEEVYIVQWETYYGPQIYRHYYTDSCFDPYLLGTTGGIGWNLTNWVEIESLPAIVRELSPIRWQEVGF